MRIVVGFFDVVLFLFLWGRVLRGGLFLSFLFVVLGFVFLVFVFEPKFF